MPTYQSTGTASKITYSNRAERGGKTSDNAWCIVTSKQKHNHKHNNNNYNDSKKSTFEGHTNHSMIDNPIPDELLLNETLVLNFKETILAAARDGTLNDLYPDDWDNDDHRACCEGRKCCQYQQHR